MRSRTRTTKKSGFSLVEVILVASILGILARALIETSTGVSGVTASTSTQALLHQQGEKALRAIIKDLRQSTFITQAGLEYPYVFDGGEADLPFEMHSHEPPEQEAEPGELDFGPNREIVFLLPADADGNGRPDYDPATGVIWSADEVGYVVVTRGDGRNHLERRINGAAPRRIAANIERIVFDTPESSGWTVPLNSVRVRLFLRRRDRENRLFRSLSEAVVRLRN